MTKVCPTVTTIRMALATRMASILPGDKKTSDSVPNTATSTTSATTTAQFAQNEGSLRRSRLERLKDPSFWANWAVVVALVVLVAVFGTLSDVFLSPGNIDAILVASAILIVVTVGQTFVIATAGIDLSIGSVVTLASVVLGYAFASAWGTGVAVLAGLLAGLVTGLISGTI